MIPGAVWRAWLVSRLVVLVALVGAELAERDGGRVETLLGWDADHYRDIAEQGYADLPQEDLRFFPLLPLLARALAPLALGSEGAALLVLVNALALLQLVLLRRVVTAAFDERVADRTVWVTALLPGAFTAVMGYAEALFGVLLLGALLLVQRRRWGLVALLGVAAGALRPTGVLLGAVVLVAALPGLRGCGAREVAARAGAAAAPLLGLAAYLGWVGHRFGDPWLPLTEQTVPGLRGGTFVDPRPAVTEGLRGALDGRLDGGGWHLLSAAVCLVLLVVVLRRCPPSWTALAVLVLLLALTSRRMTSFERYTWSAFPLAVGAALVLTTRARQLVAAAAGGGALALASYAAFTGGYVP